MLVRVAKNIQQSESNRVELHLVVVAALEAVPGYVGFIAGQSGKCEPFVMGEAWNSVMEVGFAQLSKLNSDSSGTPQSYQYACTLMKPEYRPQVSEQYKKKIENIVRKPPPEADQKDSLEATRPCMYCSFTFTESQLDCLNCKNISPFCIATGMRMLKDDWPQPKTLLVICFRIMHMNPVLSKCVALEHVFSRVVR
ncbi:unnamed protein product [Polarella glacialis]|uniref:Uncharacterized protein n=1 Tax=Polarella glacialis TaxID=89957 RepID=A0A813E9J5_POLGL|nr:unnamed protein product [Polarella glacialis]